MKRLLSLAMMTGVISITPLPSSATPLPAGTTLTINPGVCSSGTLVSGSAFAVAFNRVPSDACLSPGLNGQVIAPGTDGGIVIGKNQISGGQELAPSSANTTPGQIDAAWFFFSAYGTDFTPAGTTNVFDSLSCSGSGCVGKTGFNSWNIAWNGNTPPDGIPMGGGVVDAWIVSGADYSLDYHLPASGPVFGDQPYTLHLEGKIVPVPPTSTPTATNTPSATPTPTPTPPAVCQVTHPFNIYIVPSSQTVFAGETATYTVSISKISCYVYAVTLSVLATNCPEPFNFSPNPIPASGYLSTLTMPTSQPHPQCSFTLVGYGEDGGSNYSAQTYLTVITPSPTVTPTSTLTPTPTPKGNRTPKPTKTPKPK